MIRWVIHCQPISMSQGIPSPSIGIRSQAGYRLIRQISCSLSHRQMTDILGRGPSPFLSQIKPRQVILLLLWLSQILLLYMKARVQAMHRWLFTSISKRKYLFQVFMILMGVFLKLKFTILALCQCAGVFYPTTQRSSSLQYHSAKLESTQHSWEFLTLPVPIPTLQFRSQFLINYLLFSGITCLFKLSQWTRQPT